LGVDRGRAIFQLTAATLEKEKKDRSREELTTNSAVGNCMPDLSYYLTKVWCGSRQVVGRSRPQDLFYRIRMLKLCK
jgi:hypothetical protein